MEAETLLSVDGQPSVEVAATKGRPCGAGMAPKVGAFSGIGARVRSGRLRSNQDQRNVHTEPNTLDLIVVIMDNCNTNISVSSSESGQVQVVQETVDSQLLDRTGNFVKEIIMNF